MAVLGYMVAGAAGEVGDAGGSGAPGTKVGMWDCNGSATSQEWTMEGNGTVGINGQCLDIAGASTANGTLIDEWICTGGANQQWTAVNGELVNPASGMCLDDPDFATGEGTQLDLWTYLQRRFEPAVERPLTHRPLTRYCTSPGRNERTSQATIRRDLIKAKTRVNRQTCSL
jgi:hypothetical protein